MKQKPDEAATLWLLLLTRLYKQIHRYYEIAFVGKLFDRLLFLIETWQISGVFRFGLTGQRNPAALRQAPALSFFHSTLPSQAEAQSSLKRWELREIILTPF